MKFRPDGTGIVQAAFAQWQNGKQELVWPKEFATAPLALSRAAVRQALSPDARSAGGVPLLEVTRVSKSFGGRARRRRRQLRARGGRAGRRHGTERLGQDHAVQPDRRRPSSRFAVRSASPATPSAGSRRTVSALGVSPAPSSSSGVRRAVGPRQRPGRPTLRSRSPCRGRRGGRGRPPAVAGRAGRPRGRAGGAAHADRSQAPRAGARPGHLAQAAAARRVHGRPQSDRDGRGHGAHPVACRRRGAAC